MSTSKMFTPVSFGEFSIKNRIIMAALTRCRATADGVPTDLMVEYYGQRASAGMILTEATVVSPQGKGYANVPGIYSKEQVEGWKKVTDKVHSLGGTIVLQLWHEGRVAHPLFSGGLDPIAPSAVKHSGHLHLHRPETEFVVPRAMTKEDIAETIKYFKTAAENAQNAGFDGVEIHSGNGYLLDQFLQTSTNLRTDEYGGSVENRTRFILEVTDAVISVLGNGRVGVNIAPRCDYNEMGDINPKETFTHLAGELGKRKIAFLYSREHIADDSIGADLKKAFGGFFVANERLTKESAEKLIEDDKADGVSFGMLYISNPDLVKRFELNAELNATVLETIYTPDHVGYTDYHFLQN